MPNWNMFKCVLLPCYLAQTSKIKTKFWSKNGPNGLKTHHQLWNDSKYSKALLFSRTQLPASPLSTSFCLSFEWIKSMKMRKFKEWWSENLYQTIHTKILTADRSLGCLDFLKMVPDVSFILRAKSIRRKVSKLTLTWTIWCLCPWILWTELWDDAIPTSVRILHYLTCMRYITKIKINITPTAQ